MSMSSQIFGDTSIFIPYLKDSKKEIILGILCQDKEDIFP